HGPPFARRRREGRHYRGDTGDQSELRALDASWVSSDGAAKESNLPSEGLPRRHGFEDRMGHQTRAAPWASLRLGTTHAGLAEISPADSSAPPAGRTTSCRRRFRLG